MSQVRIKLSPFVAKIAQTGLAMGANLVATMVVIRLLARELGPDEFGAYALARRIIANMGPLLLLSLDIGLRRFLAVVSDRKSRAGYVVAALAIIGPMFATLLIVGIIFERALSDLVFGGPGHYNLYRSLFIFLGGYAIAMVVYASYLGLEQVGRANALLLMLFSCAPVAVALAIGERRDAALPVRLMGAALYFAGLPLMVLLSRLGWPGVRSVQNAAGQLLRFGVPRVPAALAFACLLSVGPVLAPHFGALKDAGFFAVSIYVLRALQTGVDGFGLVVLPKIAQAAAANDTEFLRSKLEAVVAMILHLGLFATAALWIWAPDALILWLGPAYAEATSTLRIVAISFTPFLGYTMLYSIIDGLDERAINTRHLLPALATATLVGLSLGWSRLGVLGLAVGTTAGLALLGLLSVGYLIRRVGLNLRRLDITTALVLNGAAGALASALRASITNHVRVGPLLVLGVVAELALFATYVYVLYRRRTPWVQEIKRRVFAEAT